VKIPEVVVVGVEKMKSKPLGYCEMSTTSEEDEVQSRGTKVGEDDEGPPRGGEEELAIVDGLA
jgi:hypothetical protein